MSGALLVRVFLCLLLAVFVWSNIDWKLWIMFDKFNSLMSPWIIFSPVIILLESNANVVAYTLFMNSTSLLAGNKIPISGQLEGRGCRTKTFTFFHENKSHLKTFILFEIDRVLFLHFYLP